MLTIGLFIAGGLGAVSRYMLSSWISERIRLVQLKFLSIGMVNIIGSMFFGAVHAWFMGTSIWYMSLGMGFCGTFTTFSTFSYEVAEMLLQRQYSRACFYILFTVVLCGLFYMVGDWIVHYVMFFNK